MQRGWVYTRLCTADELLWELWLTVPIPDATLPCACLKVSLLAMYGEQDDMRPDADVLVKLFAKATKVERCCKQ